MKLDINIIKLCMTFVKKDAAKLGHTWEEIAKYAVINSFQILAVLGLLAGFAWIIKHF